MKKGAFVLGMTVGVLVLFALMAYAAETVTLTGTIEVTTDDNDNVTAVALITADDDSYRITMDAKGKELGQKMAGAKVKVSGTVAEKDDEAWLTVQTYAKVGGDEE